MFVFRPAQWQGWLAGIGWVLLLALLPWWLGLPLLLSLAAALLMGVERLHAHATVIHRALGWGLPGVLFAVLRWLGNHPLGWAVILLGGLVGFTLLAALEAWLDRDKRQAPAAPPSLSSWPELAMRSVGPPAKVIELQPPDWHEQGSALVDTDGSPVRCQSDGSGACTYLFADGSELDAAPSRACVSPGGRWFVAQGPHRLLLWDRQRHRTHRLRQWQLCGWHADLPWLLRSESDLPVSLAEAMGQGNPDD
jgi:hypothetical protein